MKATTVIVGNLTRDPELRFTSSGTAFASFGVAVNNRRKTETGWEDGDPDFFDIVCWRQLAENVTESFSKGERVICVGRLSQRRWESDDGTKHSKVELVAEEVGHSILWATSSVTRNDKGDRPQRQTMAPEVQRVEYDEQPF